MSNPMLDDIQDTYERGDKALVAYTSGGGEIRALSRLSQTSDTVPKLIAALRAVEALHVPSTDHGAGFYATCDGCYEAGGADGAPLWPCPTITAIREALNG